MKVQEAPMELLNLDKSNWKRYRFDQIATSIGERVEPKDTDIQIYYGLEHLDSGSLHLKRSGTPADVEGTKLRVYPGDVIFGKRRAYQRKAAVCEVDAICSAHAMVLRANPKVIHPRLFPFFLHSDAFMNRAIDISVGSLSPTINWGTLKVQEFLLPPKDQQEKLAELLWAGDEVVERQSVLASRIFRQGSMLIDGLFGRPNEFFESFELKTLNECCFFQAGIAKGKKYSSNDELISVPYLRVANVQDGYLDLSEIKEIVVTTKEKSRYALETDDILITEGGDLDKVGRGTIWKGEVANCIHQNHVFAIRAIKEVLLPEFLIMQTTSAYGKDYFLKCAKKTANLASINSTQVKAFPVIIPSISKQLFFAKRFESISNQLASTQELIIKTKAVLSRIVDECFSPI